jgi:hypothetical protein
LSFSPGSPCLHMAFSFLYVCFQISITLPVISFGPQPNSVEPHRNFTIYAKTLFPSKITFTGTGV